MGQFKRNILLTANSVDYTEIEFDPLERIAIAFVKSGGDLFSILDQVQEASVSVEANINDHSRIGALVSMAIVVRLYGPSRFARYLSDFKNAGFTGQHLDLLVESMSCRDGALFPAIIS